VRSTLLEAGDLAIGRFEKTFESENALELERRRLLLEAANAAYAKMREDPTTSKAFDEETLEWDAT
jgi:hypothetical protein